MDDNISKRSNGIGSGVHSRSSSRPSLSPSTTLAKASLDIVAGESPGNEGNALPTDTKKNKKKGTRISHMLNPAKWVKRRDSGIGKPPKTTEISASTESSISNSNKPAIDQSTIVSVSLSGQTSQTSLTTPSTSILTSKSVLALKTAAKEQADDLQKDTGFFRKAYDWVPEDRKFFLDTIDEIRKGVDSLEKLLEYRQPSRRSSIFGNMEASAVTPNTKSVRRALKRLDDSLASQASRKKPILITIKLTVDFKRDFRTLARQEGNIHFRPDVFAFILKVHHGDLSTKATQVCAEITEAVNVSPLQEEYPPRITDLTAALSDVEPEEEHDWRTVGSFWKSSNRNDVHRLFVYTPNVYSSERNLRNLLEDARFAETKALLRTKLATLLTYSHLYFAEIRRSHAEQIVKPADFVYYKAHQSQNWDEMADYLTGPYLSMGLGEKPARIEVGEESGITEDKINPLAQLGLLLFQVASCEPVDYGNGGMDGLRRAKTRMLEKLHQVDRSFGPAFTEIVELCLSTKDRVDLDDAWEEEDELVGKIIKWLAGFQEKLEQRSGDFE